MADLKKARELLRSVITTNPRHAPGWIAMARLEARAKKMQTARQVGVPAVCGRVRGGGGLVVWVPDVCGVARRQLPGLLTAAHGGGGTPPQPHKQCHPH